MFVGDVVLVALLQCVVIVAVAGLLIKIFGRR